MASRLAVAVCAGAMSAGCVGLGAPVLEGAFVDAPADWEQLPPAARHARGWQWHRHGVDYAGSAALRDDARLLATGARRAAEGLEICATALADEAARDALQEVAKGYRSLERQARGGRLFRPRVQLDDLEARAWAFRPGTAVLAAPPVPPMPPAPVEPTAPPAAPVATPVAGTVVRKRVDVAAGPAGEVTTWVITVLQSGGAQVDVAVDEPTWRAAVIGDAAPGSKEKP